MRSNTSNLFLTAHRASDPLNFHSHAIPKFRIPLALLCNVLLPNKVKGVSNATEVGSDRVRQVLLQIISMEVKSLSESIH